MIPLPEDDVAVVRLALDAFSCSGRNDELADRATNAFTRLENRLLGPYITDEPVLVSLKEEKS